MWSLASAVSLVMPDAIALGAPWRAVVVALWACVAGRAVCMRSRPVLQQLQRRLPAPGEELIRQVPVRQRPGELERADHEAEDCERVRSSRLGVCPVETGRD